MNLRELVKATERDSHFDGLRKPCEFVNHEAHTKRCIYCQGTGWVPVSGPEALAWMLEFQSLQHRGVTVGYLVSYERFYAEVESDRMGPHMRRWYDGEADTPWDALADAVGKWLANVARREDG